MHKFYVKELACAQNKKKKKHIYHMFKSFYLMKIIKKELQRIKNTTTRILN